MNLTINKAGGGILATIQPSEESYRYRKVSGEDVVRLSFDITEFISLPAGVWIEWQGERYTLLAPPEVTKENERHWSYRAEFHRGGELLRRWRMKHRADGAVKFPLSADLSEHLRMLIDSANSGDPEEGWSIHPRTLALTTTPKLVQYNHTDCLSALGLIAEAFQMEWVVRDKQIEVGVIESGKENPLLLSYGQGKGLRSGVRRMNAETHTALTRLYLETSDRNIYAHRYGSSRLHLPQSLTFKHDGEHFLWERGYDSRKGVDYRTDSAGLYVERYGTDETGVEGSLDATDIYPRRESTLTSWELVERETAEKHPLYAFTDSTIPEALDYGESLIPNEALSIVFQSGLLAGQSFEAEYSHSQRKFTLRGKEVDGVWMPGEPFVSSRGDKYAVFGVDLPRAYVRDDVTRSGAEYELLRKAVAEIAKSHDKPYAYRAEVDGRWASADWMNRGGRLQLGAWVELRDDRLLPEGHTLRVLGYKDYLHDPTSPEIELGTQSSASGILSTISKVEQQSATERARAEEATSRATAQTLQQALTAAEAVAKTAAGEFANSINPATIHTLQTTVGSTERQFRLYPAGSTQETTLEPSYSCGILEIGQALDLRHQSLGNTNHTLSPSETTKGMSQWRLQPFRSGYIGDEEKPLYLYAVCPTYNSSAEWRLEKEPHELESEAGRYWLLAGLVQVKPDYSFTRLYGFTSITPGQVRVDRIVSADGNSYFDLVTGVIAGKFKFILPNGGVSDKPDNIIADILAEAKGYSDSTTGKTLKDARAYADSKDKDSRSYTDKALKDARGYADERQLEAQYNANSYTDEKSREAMGFAEQGDREARAYTDTKSKEGKTYTDQKSKEDKDYTDAKDKAARAYTDERIKAIENNKNVTDYLRKAIQDGSTDIYGGLILTNFLAARDPETKQVRSFIAGSQDNKLPAFAAGVTNFGRDTYDAKVRIEHDGRAVFNSMYINDSGYYGDCVIFRNPGFKTNKDVQAILLRIGGDFLPDPKDLAKKGKGWDRNENIGDLTQKVRRRIASLSMPEEYTGARWTVTITLSFLFGRDKEEKINSMLKPIRVKAYFGNTLIGTSESYQIYGTGGNNGLVIPTLPGGGSSAFPDFKPVKVKMRDIVWDSRYNGEADNLRLELDTENTYDFEISCGVRVQASVGENANRGMVIADNGFTAYGDPKRWFQMKVTGSNTPTLRMRGEADIPGLLFAVRVSNGSIVKRWGYYANDVTMRAGYGSDWVFTHNLGHNNYICTAHVLSHDHASVSLKEESANTITLYVTDNGRGNRVIAFTLLVFGEGKAMG